MTLATRSPLTVHVPLRVDPEQEMVTRLIEATGEAGLAVDPASIINFYVALKSKPLAILAGPAQSGKIALVESWAHILFGGDCLRCQMMIGHPCWAAQHDDSPRSGDRPNTLAPSRRGSFTIGGARRAIG